MLRNREFGRFAIVFTFIAGLTIIGGFAINTAAGLLTLASSIILGIAFFIFTNARYQSIARISNQIDLVLHNTEHLYIGEADEGELSILHSEITKLLMRIREQNEELKKEKQHLAESLADIAHQLRTPLTSINLIMSLLANNPDKDERKAFIRETEGLLLQMDWLLTSLLKLSRLDAGIVVFQSEQLELNDLLKTSLRPLLIPMELRNIHMKMDVQEGIIIQGDGGWLAEAIQNILKNCMESIGADGEIEITCKETPLFTDIVIHDSGAGFEKQDLPCLFDRFYRGNNPSATGYGIGLALCKTIITRLGGTITASNHPQGGAVFAIRFLK